MGRHAMPINTFLGGWRGNAAGPSCGARVSAHGRGKRDRLSPGRNGGGGQGMSEDIEQAQQALEHAHEADAAHPAHNDRGARRVAVLISALAAALAIAEMGEKGAQNDFLAHHISTSDAWAFYQAKTLRAAMAGQQIELLESLPNAADPDLRKRIEAAQAERARLDDDEATQGRKQLRAEAEADARERDAIGHHYHLYEIVVGALQIAIVLASVSVVTRMWLLAAAAGALGGVAVLFGLGVAWGVG
jgi:Domain of unknown function (DUF4337)